VVDGVEVLNFCDGAPRSLERQVITVLRLMGAPDLAGLRRIMLEDRLPDPTREDADRYKEVLALGEPLYGWYAEATPTEPTTIGVHIPDVLGGLPRFLWWTPCATILIARTVAHEMGDHLLSVAGTIFDSEAAEDTEAHRHAVELLNAMAKRWRYRFAGRILRWLGGKQSAMAVSYWEKTDYRSALFHWGRATNLGTTRGDAGYWYDRAREKCILAASTSARNQPNEHHQE
jgi:hypothetical protein